MNPDKYPGRSDFFTKRTWPEFLELVAASRDPNYLGLLLPLHLRCAPCTFSYDAILNMDTFEQDVRHLMHAAGATWVQCLQEVFFLIALESGCLQKPSAVQPRSGLSRLQREGFHSKNLEEIYVRSLLQYFGAYEVRSLKR